MRPTGEFVSEATGRVYWVDEDGIATLEFDSVDHRDAEFASQAEAEIRAEFAMNWVMGGGAKEDIAAAWTQGIRA